MSTISGANAPAVSPFNTAPAAHGARAHHHPQPAAKPDSDGDHDGSTAVSAGKPSGTGTIA